MRPNTILFATAFATSLVTSCVTGGDLDELDEAEADLWLDEEPDDSLLPLTADLAAACPVSNTSINRSLVVTDASALAKVPFATVMNRIKATANVATTQTNAAVFQSWMKTFGATAAAGDCNDTNIDPQRYGLVCPRPAEAKLATINPFAAASAVTFKPVGLFNRFDLAPSNGANCGEYRIVYAMSSTNPNIGGRGFIIFEATLPNPTPAAGIAACLPVARFWQDLTADANATSRASKLEKFYLLGTAIPGFGAVVKAQNYGFANGVTAAHGTGQVRTNMFIDFAEWHLREFKLRRTCTNSADVATCKLAFSHVTVKTNPANELFTGTHAQSAAFRTSFAAQVAALIRPNVATLAMSTPNQFNEFESVSQRLDVNYAGLANAALRTAIQGSLTTLNSTLTVNNVLARATTQTCAGCHQVSNGAALGGGLTWPSSLTFVQIDETSALSPALTTKFLPRRKAVLESFINNRCAPAALAAMGNPDDGLTIGGSPVGAAN